MPIISPSMMNRRITSVPRKPTARLVPISVVRSMHAHGQGVHDRQDDDQADDHLHHVDLLGEQRLGLVVEIGQIVPWHDFKVLRGRLARKLATAGSVCCQWSRITTHEVADGTRISLRA